MNVLMMLIGSHQHTTITLSGATVEGTTSAEHGIIIRTDGTIDQQANGTTTQLSPTTDWIIPNSAAATDYEFRVTGVTWDIDPPFSTSPGVDEAWYDLTGGDLSWFVQDLSSTAAGANNVSFTLEVRKGSSGTALASATYNINVDWEV